MNNGEKPDYFNPKIIGTNVKEITTDSFSHLFNFYMNKSVSVSGSIFGILFLNLI